MRQLETAATALKGEQEGDRPRDRATGDVSDAEQLERRRRVVRVGLTAGEPAEAAVSRLVRDDEPRRRRCRVTERQHRPDRGVERLADLAARARGGLEPPEQCARDRAERTFRQGNERDVRRRAERRLLRLEVGERARCGASGGAQAQDRPRGQRRVGGAARLGVRTVHRVRLEELCRGDGQRAADDEWG